MIDEWDDVLINIEAIYGPALATKLSDLVDQGKVDEVNHILSTLQ